MFKKVTRKVVKTRNFKGKVNGKLVELGSVLDGWTKFLNNSQIYLTSIKPGEKKGFHLHHKKENQVTCIRGRLVLGIWDGKKITEMVLDARSPQTIRIPRKHALCFLNKGKEEAFVLNLCSPPYDPKDREQEDLDLEWNPKIS